MPDAYDDEIEVKEFEFDVGGGNEGRRLDAYMAARFADYSRTFIKALIQEGMVTVNGRQIKPSYTTSRGDHVHARVPMRRQDEVPPEDIPLDIIYEDEWLVVVNKPADLVVHPSRGHQTGTLVNALVHRFQKLSGVYGNLRPGIVHRLDRDTTGAILVIKDDSVHEDIARQFEERDVRKEYVAVCEGCFQLDSDLIDAPIGHDRRTHDRMMVRSRGGKPARTVYKVEERLGAYTLVRCFPRSGRTHQIRVHMQYIGHPIVADALYSHRDAFYESELRGEEQRPDEEPVIARHALHARRITIHHPVKNEDVTFEAPIPEDMARLIDVLRGYAEEGGRRQ